MLAKNKLFRGVIFLSYFFTIFVRAEPTSPPLTLADVRPYGNELAFITAHIPTGSFCALNFYSINLSSNAGRAMYAAALLAVAQKKMVKLEIVACGTGEAGSNLLQSITFMSD